MEVSLPGQTDSYKVNMIPFGENALDSLREEIFSTEPIGKKRILNCPSAFDTETSSFIDKSDGEKSAIVYVWMFGIGHTVVYGRELDEFVSLVDELNLFLSAFDFRLITYVHFLKYDFSFIKYVLKWDKVFLKDNRDVLYATSGNIEFRDSLVLSGGQSLASISKKLRVPIKKAVGDLDYSLLRHPQTHLTNRELHYCEFDIRSLNEYIREKIEDDGDIAQIPYTNTGYVRRFVREQCFKHRRSYMQYISGLTMTPDCYIQAESAFTGGSVYGSLKYVNSKVKDVQSWDIKSSYPYVMCTGYYPTNYFTPVQSARADQLENYLNNYCCLFTFEAWNVEPLQEYYFPISKHKCLEVIGPTSDSDVQESASGRIMAAMYLRINLTELDLKTLRKFYKFGEWRISCLRIAPRGYLPSPITHSVIEFFNKKTTLDGVEGREREYMIAKNMLNAIYGMMVEKPIRPVFGFNGAEFTTKAPDFVQQIEEYNEKYNRFLFYPWGVWVTAHARFRLHNAIYHLKDDFVYCDTDSVKFVGNHNAYFEKANKQAIDAMFDFASREHLSPAYVMPNDPEGNTQILGVWKHEWNAYHFKTLGAKRYLIEFSWKEKGNKSFPPETEYELTVAGTNKDDTLSYLINRKFWDNADIFDIFSPELIVPAKYAKRTVSRFIDEERTGWVSDYLGNKYYYVAPSGIHVSPTTYSFSITDEMVQGVEWALYGAHWQDGQI